MAKGNIVGEHRDTSGCPFCGLRLVAAHFVVEKSVMSVETESQSVLVEVLTASGCGRCQKIKALTKEVIAELNDDRVRYQEINVVDDIDYAVRLGVMSTPAIALNGELEFSGPPSKAKLRQAILKRLVEPSAPQGKVN
jgi:thioredoxin 1